MPTRCIDVDFAFAGFYNYDASVPRGPRRGTRDDTYSLSMAKELPGFEALESRGYQRLLSPRRERIPVFRKLAASVPQGCVARFGSEEMGNERREVHDVGGRLNRTRPGSGDDGKATPPVVPPASGVGLAPERSKAG